MRNLSLELLMLIASNLDENDVPDFRLVSHLFASVGIEYLNVKKHFFFRKHSLERLSLIAEHPILCRNLKEIVFFVDVVPAYDSQEKWEAQARATCHTNHSEGRDHLAAQWLQRYRLYEIVPVQKIDDHDLRMSGWQTQQKIRHEQDMLSTDSTIFEELQRSLSKLQALNSFSLETFEQYHRELMRPLFTVNKYQDWYCCNYNCALESFRGVTTRLVHAVLTREEPNSCTRAHLTTLSTHITAFTNADPQEWTFSSWQYALQHVQSLQLRPVSAERLDPQLLDGVNNRDPDFVHPQDNEEDSQEKVENFLQQLLINVKNLRSLALKLPPRYDFKTQLIFEDCRWAYIAHLNLSCVDIDPPSFEAFLSWHKSSLETLGFSNVLISSTSDQQHAWIDLLKFIKLTLRLTYIAFGGRLTEDHLGLIDFNGRATQSLRSGLKVDVQDIARFLICGLYPAILDPTHPDRDEFSSLGWQDLMAGYD